MEKIDCYIFGVIVSDKGLNYRGRQMDEVMNEGRKKTFTL